MSMKYLRRFWIGLIVSGLLMGAISHRHACAAQSDESEKPAMQEETSFTKGARLWVDNR